MSSTESSGAPAEGTATSPAPATPAAPASFGSTRGSGLARGKRPTASPAPHKAATPADYKPTAIEVVSTPREYQNPFAPANPEPATPTPADVTPAPADVAPAEDIAAPDADPAAKPELNILPPERPKPVEAQTWESAGFTGGDTRPDRPRREERHEPSEPIDPAAIPEKFLYVRPGVNYAPTNPNKWGPGRRDRAPEKSEGLVPRSSPPRSSEPAPVAAPGKSGGFFGWIKSLFGGGSSAEPATAGQAQGEYRHHRGGRRHHRGSGVGETRDDAGHRPGGGSGRRRRGGRGRGERGAPPRHEGGDTGGSMAT